MLTFAINVTFAALGISLVLCLIRLIRGPSAPDRILALDTLYINAVAILIVLGVSSGSTIFFEAALLIALMGFIGTVALARYIARGDVVE